MPDMLAIAEAALRSSMASVDTVSRNIANVGTHGYKRELRADADFSAFLDGAKAATPAVRDWSSGSLQYTGAPLHFAIEGDAWFQLRSPEGIMLSRDGAFRLNGDGTLVSQEGWPVVLDADAVIPSGNLALRQGNELWSGDIRIGQFQLVKAPPAELQSMAPGVYRAANAVQADAQNSHLRQGYLESSNVNSLNEMVELIDALRRAEASQRMMRAYDDALETALTTLGEF